MIRLATKEDEDAILSLAEATGLFDKDQLDLLRETFRSTVEDSDRTKVAPFWLS